MIPTNVHRLDAKLAAVECWTADPCGYAPGQPGSASYAEALLAARDSEAPWMTAALDYESGRGRDVLDVGCGQGIDLIRFAQADAKVTGLDITPRHAELARAHLEALGLDGAVVEGDAEALPFPDRCFNIVTSNGVLHHTPNIVQALAEIRRVLRPGGEARIILYNRRSAHFWLWQWLWLGRIHGQLRGQQIADVLSANVERSSIGARPLVHVYTPREVRRLLTAAGFTDVRTIVRQFRWRDIPGGHRVDGRLPRTSGRWFGWYVTGYGSAR